MWSEIQACLDCINRILTQTQKKKIKKPQHGHDLCLKQQFFNIFITLIKMSIMKSVDLTLLKNNETLWVER